MHVPHRKGISPAIWKEPIGDLWDISSAEKNKKTAYHSFLYLLSPQRTSDLPSATADFPSLVYTDKNPHITLKSFTLTYVSINKSKQDTSKIYSYYWKISKKITCNANVILQLMKYYFWNKSIVFNIINSCNIKLNMIRTNKQSFFRRVLGPLLEKSKMVSGYKFFYGTLLQSLAY